MPSRITSGPMPSPAMTAILYLAIVYFSFPVRFSMDVKNEGMPLTVTVFAYPFYPEIDLVRLVPNQSFSLPPMIVPLFVLVFSIV
jgi:hypothetical protein